MSTSAAAPMSRMPFCVTRRSESRAKRAGSQRSMAMLDSTRGPSTKPACAATKRSSASETRVTSTKPPPRFWPQPSVTAAKSTALSVLPSCGRTEKSR